MKAITLKKSQPLDLFGVVVLQPGPNAVDLAVWDKVKDLKLGHMDVPYVQYARAEDILSFEDESPAVADVSGSGPSDVVAVQSAPVAAEPVPESSVTAADPLKKRGRPPKGA